MHGIKLPGTPSQIKLVQWNNLATLGVLRTTKSICAIIISSQIFFCDIILPLHSDTQIILDYRYLSDSKNKFDYYL